MRNDRAPLSLTEARGKGAKVAIGVRIRRLLRVALVALAAGAAFPAAAASFDCARARAPDEIAICRDPGLSALDSQLGGLWYGYNKVPMLMGSNGARHDDAVQFLRTRAACGAHAQCLGQAYRARIAVLKSSIDEAMQDVFRQENRDSPAPPPPAPAPRRVTR